MRRRNNIYKIILIILLFINFNLSAKEKKFKSSEAGLYETPTRYIIVVVNGDRGVRCTKNVGCANAYYYEINKKTGKGLKLKGTTINIGPSLSFKGYDFDYKDLNYRIILQGKSSFVINKMQDSNIIEDTILNEPIIEYHFNY